MATTYKAYADQIGGTAATDYIGRPGDIFWDQANGALRVSDGATAGGTLIGGGGATTWAAITNINNANGPDNIAVGNSAGLTNQGTSGIALGSGAGNANQGDSAIAIGSGAGLTT